MEDSPQSVRHYSAGQVALACFLGSVPAASWLMARTYRAAANQRKERKAIIWGIVGTIAVLVLVFIIPDDASMGVVPIGLTIGFFQMAKQLQAPTVAELESRGGRKASWWAAAGIGFVGFVIVWVAIMGIASVLPE